MRKIVLFILVAYLARAYEYNKLLLRTQSSLYPKLMLMDKKLSSHIKDKRIDFYILVTAIDRLYAKYLKKQLDRLYGRGMGGYRFCSKIVNFSTFLADKRSEADAIYVLKAKGDILKKVAKKIANKRDIYSFTYEKKDLLFGFLCNVAIEKEVAIYINKKVLLRGDFEFLPQLYQISRFIEP